MTASLTPTIAPSHPHVTMQLQIKDGHVLSNFTEPCLETAASRQSLRSATNAQGQGAVIKY